MVTGANLSQASIGRMYLLLLSRVHLDTFSSVEVAMYPTFSGLGSAAVLNENSPAVSCYASLYRWLEAGKECCAFSLHTRAGNSWSLADS